MISLNAILPPPFYEINQICFGKNSTTDAYKMAKRLAVAALPFFLNYQIGLDFSKGVLAGGILSVPGSLLAGGYMLLYHAARKAVEDLAMSFGCLAAGYIVLKNYDYVCWGFLELEQVAAVPKKPLEADWKKSELYLPVRSQSDRLKEITDHFQDVKTVYEEEGESKPDIGIFNYSDVQSKLGTQEAVEFFYSARNATNDVEARQHILKITGNGKQQVYYASFRNVFPFAFSIDGKVWQSREHYVQAQKFKEDSATYQAILKGEGNFSDAELLEALLQNPEYEMDLRLNSDADWEKWHEYESYHFLLMANLAFFGQHEEQFNLLMGTENLPIVERGSISSRYGISFSDGCSLENEKGERVNRNMQGWILMKLRYFFREI